MTGSDIFLLIVAIVVVDQLVDFVLDFLNISYSPAKLPKVLEGVYNDEDFEKSKAYKKANGKFGFISSLFSFSLLLGVLYFEGFAFLNDYLGQYFQDQLYLALAFFGVIYIINDILAIPFELYSTFVIEEKFGFNKMKLGTFIMDKVKGYVLAILLGGLLIGALFSLVVAMGENFWIIFWVIVSSLLVLLNMFYTSLIVPLFNKLTPLEDGELREAIEAYSKKINFALNDIYVVDGSKRSSKANAYFSGIGKKKKIVLYDTLIEKNTPEELVAVLAHEVGHFKKKHIIATMVISVFQVGAILFLLSKAMFTPEVSEALGATNVTEPIYHLNLVAFGFLFTPLSKVIGVLMSLFSRKNEYEADAYAKETFSGEALSSALKNLSVHNLTNLTPHPAYVFMHYSHPTLLERLEALEK